MEPLSRKQEKVCVSCKKTFWSWGMKRDRCLICDPIPPRLAKLYFEQIQSGHVHVRL